MKISSCLLFAFLLVVSLAFAVETMQHETVTKEAKGATEANKVELEAKGAAKVEPAGSGGGGNWGGGGGNWGGGGGCRHGCCYRGYRGCQKCCSSPEEAKALAVEALPHETVTKEAKVAPEANKVEPEAKGAGEANKVEPAGGGGGNWGGGGGNWGGGGGGYGCRHGCCYRGYRGCQRCCSSPEEAKALAVETSQHDTMTKEEANVATKAEKEEPEAKGATEANKVEPAGGGGGNWGGGGGNWGGGGGNWGGGGGGYGCRHGCCYRGYRGCQRCCSSPEEAKAVAGKQLRP